MVSAAGRRLEVATIAGDSQRAAIVMLHEGLGSLGLWRDLPQQLAARTGRTVVVFSRHGYGRSEPFAEPREPTYMHDEARTALPALLAELGIAKPVLFGHSDGASIALLYAADHPVTALVLEAPHVFVEDLSVRSIAAVRDAYATTDLREKLARRHDDVDATFRGWNDIWLDARFRDWNITADVARITAPVLLIQGDADEYGTDAQLAAIATRVPRAEIVMAAGAGHSPHRDDPELVLARTSAFLATLP
jgi:pimeloyl-ACP methyl ester carboxylesterase